jgi:hypothetical protein
MSKSLYNSITFHVLSQHKVVNTVSGQHPYFDPSFYARSQQEREAQQAAQDAARVLGQEYVANRMNQEYGQLQQQEAAQRAAAEAAYVRDLHARQMRAGAVQPKTQSPASPTETAKPKQAAPSPKPLTPEEFKAKEETRKREAAEAVRSQIANREAARQLASRQKSNRIIARICGLLVLVGFLPALMSIGSFGSLINPVTILYAVLCWAAWYLDTNY